MEEAIGGAAPQTVELFLNGGQKILEKGFDLLVGGVRDLHRQMSDSIVKAASGHAKWGAKGRARPHDSA